MTRLHIMGPPGSGKTTLAQRLTSQLNIPFYELDNIAWEEGYPGTERPLEDRLCDIHNITIQPAWVTEGIFLFWTDELLRAANYIVWLDMSWHLVLKRVVARRLDWSLRSSETGVNPPTNPLKQLQLLSYLGTYYLSKSQTDTRAFLSKYLRTYQNKLVHCHYPAEVDAFFMDILAQEQGHLTKP